MSLTQTEAIEIATRGHALKEIYRILGHATGGIAHLTPKQYLELALLALNAAAVAVDDDLLVSRHIDDASADVEDAFAELE